MPDIIRSWQEELEIIDSTMKAISELTDPEEVVTRYWEGISALLPSREHVALSRRGMNAPEYLITRSSRFTEDINPWTQRDRLPRMSGGLLGEIAYANKPMLIEDLPSKLSRNDPGWFYLQGFGSLVAFPQYELGEALNVLVALMPQGMKLDHRLIPTLHWQGALFARGTQNLVLRNQLTAALTQLDRELQVVGEIQRSLLPAQFPDVPGLNIASYYSTSTRAGGDYYDFWDLGDAIGILIADVSGHGAPAAVLMAITHALARSHPQTQRCAHSHLTYLNNQLAQSYARNGTFVTAFYGILDVTRGIFKYSRAGHNPPRVVREGKILPLDAAGALPLGLESDQLFETATVQLKREDRLVLYTDGITEASPPLKRNEAREMFGTSRLDELLVRYADQSPKECVEAVRAELRNFCEAGPQNDDQTLIVMDCA